MFKIVSRHVYAGPRPSLNLGASMTVPDMSLSLRDMLNRHKAGGVVKTFNPVYVDPESKFPLNFERMSQIDRKQMSLDLSDFIADTRGRLISARQQAKNDAIAVKVAARAAAKAVVDDVDVE